MSLRSRSTALCAALMAALLLGTAGCSLSGDDGGSPSAGSSTAAAQDQATEVPFDVRPLVEPEKKYFGAALEKAPTDMAPVERFTALTGKQPNLIEYYAAFGDGFNAKGVRNAWQSGALTIMSWEPFDVPLADIAGGKSDAYLKQYAAAVRKLNLPLAISFADEMNGHWEKWGTKHVESADYVKAWKHVHDVFTEAGASNVIWTWTPNIVNPVKNVDLADYYPGDAYVDWVGMVGYFTAAEDNAFDSVFGPTIEKIRTLTKKPMVVVETAAAPGERRRADIRNLFAGIEGDDDIVGFVWFDYRKRADWRLSASPLALAEFKRLVANDLFGFDVRKP
ncbi:glycoside hydrolase family 26 protein [Streptomyces sp. NPDC059881]|uniref:glycoside hydrolase family 26 protein n=1 Tax=Streptomyces sp. NPDC059881 TaxID=3346986 RepID=UPI0036512AFF